ncbi:H(+) hexose cotransporter 2 [Micractinium conductrix]|uniref:H(+) hexose cotransporter 2 n=1 Tax=Micractinium conductrix TaxID=554055 RepID=A0A2P6VQ10_9CHLO|nr:H(+) hexose cotransporter 2 [Micractinium conductrix]|eukprot:PSC76169.1 H(+) hexose cotransporter 2 [Micractinium conductrix]
MTFDGTEGKAPLMGSSSSSSTGTAQGGRVQHYQGKMTIYVLVVALVSATGGLLFGYDISIIGGVEAMASFQQQFFPEIYARSISGAPEVDPYCKFHDTRLQLFSAIMFLSGAVVAVPAGAAARMFGRKVSMLSSGSLFLVGAGLQAGAHSLTQLVIGRCVLGFGVGTAACVVPVYISEVAPYASRGGLAYLFQMATTVGILSAQLVNYGTQYIPVWGWRLSLGLAAMPACILCLGGLALPESPSYLIEKGRWAEGKAVLQMLRGTDEVDAEYADIMDAAQTAAKVSTMQSWRNLVARQNLPMTLMATSLAALQQLTGINAIIFYAPIMFSSLANSTAALLNAVVIGGVNVAATFVGLVLVDSVGRRPLLLEGGVQMTVSQIATGVILATSYSAKDGSQVLSSGAAAGALVCICLFIAGFAWSWGPVVWVLGAEVQTLETRTSGMSAVVASNYLLSFAIGQGFLSMLCGMKWGVFIFFAAWNIVMTAFVYFLLPETKGVPLEDTAYACLFARHPVWRRVMGKAGKAVLEREAFRDAAWRQAKVAEGGDLR